MRHVAFALAVLFSVSAAAVPGTIAYQGRLLDDKDDPIDTDISVTLRFFKDRIPGDNETPLHTETFSTRAAKGLFAVELGKQGFPAGLFDHDDVWIEAQITGGPALQPRLRLVAAPFAMKAAGAIEADHAKLADEAKALTAAALVPAAQIDGKVATAAHADDAKGLTADAKLPAAQIDGQVANAASADVAKALTSDASVPAVQVAGKVSAAVTADKLGTKTYDDLTNDFASKSHVHSAADITTGSLSAALLAAGSITKDKLATGAVEQSAFTPSGNVVATTIGTAISEVDSKKARYDSLPLAPNYLRDTRFFRLLAMSPTGAETYDAFVDLANSKAPWEWVKYADSTGKGTVNSAQVRKTKADVIRANPSTYPEYGTINTLLTTSGDGQSAGYADYSIADFKVDITGTGSGGYTAAFLRQGCQRYGGVYDAHVPTTTSAMLKVIQVGTNQTLRVASNGWPSQTFSTVTSDWVAMNAQGSQNGGCLDLFSIECNGSCTGTVRFAIALPYVSAGRRTGVAWSGYSTQVMDDVTSDAGGVVTVGFAAAASDTTSNNNQVTHVTMPFLKKYDANRSDLVCQYRFTVNRPTTGAWHSAGIEDSVVGGANYINVQDSTANWQTDVVFGNLTNIPAGPRTINFRNWNTAAQNDQVHHGQGLCFEILK